MILSDIGLLAHLTGLSEERLEVEKHLLGPIVESISDPKQDRRLTSFWRMRGIGSWE